MQFFFLFPVNLLLLVFSLSRKNDKALHPFSERPSIKRKISKNQKFSLDRYLIKWVFLLVVANLLRKKKCLRIERFIFRSKWKGKEDKKHFFFFVILQHEVLQSSLVNFIIHSDWDEIQNFFLSISRLL